MRRPQPFSRRTFLTGLSDLGMVGLIGSNWRPSPRPPTQADESLTPEKPRSRLDRLTCSDFSRYLGESFLAEPASAPPFALTLLEARLLRTQPHSAPGLATRLPFSIVFHGPAESRLEQGICRVEHRGLGVLDLFFVPIGPQTDVVYYEAIFS